MRENANGKVIITCAITGSIHTPSMSKYLPLTAEEIGRAAIEAAEAGAAIVHMHARNPIDFRADQSPEAFEPFLKMIKAHSDVVVNLTTGGSPYIPLDQRIKPAVVFKPEVASLNMGSMNLGLFPMLLRYKDFKYAWEREMLEGSHDLVFKNTYKDIRFVLETLRESGTKFEFECYDTAHLHNLHYFYREGVVKAPLFIQTVFGLMGGIGSHPDEVLHLRRTADRLFGNDYSWSALGAGKAQMSTASLVASLGGNVRVGMEDSLWLRKGQLATSNSEQVVAAKNIIEGLGLSVATPDEARKMLELKGRDKVAF